MNSKLTLNNITNISNNREELEKHLKNENNKTKVVKRKNELTYKQNIAKLMKNAVS